MVAYHHRFGEVRVIRGGCIGIVRLIKCRDSSMEVARIIVVSLSVLVMIVIFIGSN